MRLSEKVSVWSRGVTSPFDWTVEMFVVCFKRSLNRVEASLILSVSERASRDVTIHTSSTARTRVPSTFTVF